MSHKLVRDTATDKIVATYHAGEKDGVCPVPDGCDLIDKDADTFSGDALPSTAKEMVRGTVTGPANARVYTAPAAVVEDAKVAALMALDPNAESGALKTIIEFLQR